MAENPEHPHGTLSRNALIAMIVLAGGLTLLQLTGRSVATLAALLTVITDGSIAAMVVLAGGGFGYLAIRKLAPQGVPSALRVVTACALGLWMLSTGVLLVGSWGRGLLNEWLWWPVIGVGAFLAMWQGRRRFNTWKIPQRSDGRALLWVAIAIAVGFWIAGASLPPGLLHTTDSYDVLEYHLQLPREFHDAGTIHQTKHNCYGHYPLGVEMLFLLAMCLRGGSYEGVYVAKFLHGAFAALAIAGLFLTLKRDDHIRGRFSVAILATTPLAIYLSWLAMVELAQVCYLAMALLWLRSWLSQKSIKAAACVGLMVGAACGVKYLSVGFVAAPVLAIMLFFAVRSFRLFGHAVAALLVAAVMFCPWLIRNTVYTGNPVFPLATQTFGRGRWSQESQQRWIDGHAAQVRPPVPAPPGHQMPPATPRLELFFSNFFASQLLGPVCIILAGLGVCMLFAERTPTDPWNWSLAGVLAVQIGVWASFTRGMPTRFMAPALVPVALLAGGVLARLAGVRTSPFRRAAAPSGKHQWGLPPAVAICAVIVGVNLVTTYGLYKHVTANQPPLHGIPAEELTTASIFKQMEGVPQLSAGARLMLVGDAAAFSFSPNTVYATAFDVHPLARLLESGLTDEQILLELRRRGITHVWMHWAEIWRLAQTYGYPASLTHELFQHQTAGLQPTLAILDRFAGAGARRFDLPERTFWPRRTGETDAPQLTWPVVSIYVLPWAISPAPPATAPTSAPTTASTPETD